MSAALGGPVFILTFLDCIEGRVDNAVHCDVVSDKVAEMLARSLERSVLWVRMKKEVARR